LRCALGVGITAVAQQTNNQATSFADDKKEAKCVPSLMLRNKMETAFIPALSCFSRTHSGLKDRNVPDKGKPCQDIRQEMCARQK